MAILLNRTLVVPDTIPPDAGDPFPTKTCRVFTCDSRAVAHAKYRINKLRNVTMRRSRPLFLMTVRVPEGWGIGYDSVRTATSDFADVVRGISVAERGVVESVVCANAHHFVATGSSSMSEWILRLRQRPPWSVLLKSGGPTLESTATARGASSPAV
ncbi:hypothetical protein JL721_12113 [Aureococcus anophagefferens]|nr:hypothetical protein JL721_12113 [Aureococcus anophagefferens]